MLLFTYINYNLLALLMFSWNLSRCVANVLLLESFSCGLLWNWAIM